MGEHEIRLLFKQYIGWPLEAIQATACSVMFTGTLLDVQSLFERFNATSLITSNFTISRTRSSVALTAKTTMDDAIKNL